MDFRLGASWTDERIEQLRGLTADSLTAAQIANAMGGITRNAVIGKVHRLGLTLARSHGHHHLPSTVPMRRRRRIKDPLLALTRERVQLVTIKPRRNAGVGGPVNVVECETLDLPPDQSDFACTIHELTATTCRWPLGMPAHDMLYCGAEHDGQGSYCTRHHRIAYTGRR
ncbi:MAG TPA: GcrA family cell cycle regulator [Hyphomicrobiaceae bacterium]|nr:GcrA family cell cycle regulator [Hyphomicrobiaceae bacterium]